MQFDQINAPAFFDMDAAPLRIGRVGLKVRDLAAVTDFYERVIGLERLEEDGATVFLGRAGRALLALTGDPALRPDATREAGLFHTAFLLPDRADLGRWLVHAGDLGVRIDGASDHAVSEAIYLADPESNGIEIYADRPEARWRRPDGTVAMTTERLDLGSLLAAAGATSWTGFPDGGRIGHVHLRVGDTALAEAFYRDRLGFQVSARYPGASFFGSGGYHHQLAGNVWASRDASRRAADRTGLDFVEIQGAGVEPRDLDDPWGNRIRLRPA